VPKALSAIGAAVRRGSPVSAAVLSPSENDRAGLCEKPHFLRPFAFPRRPLYKQLRP